MTTLLETAFEKASSLSEIEQNRFAKLFISEIESEKKWDALFSGFEVLLAEMADEALKGYVDGETEPLDTREAVISHTHKNFWKFYRKLPANIREQAKKQYFLFQNDPYNASLHFKCVHSSKPVYSARVARDYRTVGILTNDVII